MMSGNNNNRILILADFMEGNSAAINFAVNYLCNDNSKIYLIQTWKKPVYGAATIKDFASVLKDVTRKELEALKTYIHKEYPLKNLDVDTISFEGELSDFFNSKTYANYNWQVVLSLKEKGMYTEKDSKIKDVKAAVNTPLYILNNYNPDEQLNSIYIKNGDTVPAQEILSSLYKICSQQSCNITVGINDSDLSNHDKRDLVKKYVAACNKSSIKFEKELNEHKLFTSNSKPILSIYHKHNIKHKVSDLMSYFDNWFFKAKRSVI